MNTHNILATILIASTLFVSVSGAHAQDRPRSRALPRVHVEKGSTQPERGFIVRPNIKRNPSRSTKDTGKIRFNEFTIKKTSDMASPTFFRNSARGSTTH